MPDSRREPVVHRRLLELLHRQGHHSLIRNYSGQCLAAADQFCSQSIYTSGNNHGEVEVFSQPVVNLGVLKTDGVDFNINYKLNNTPIGNFAFNIDATHINKYDSIPIAGGPVTNVAGTFDRQFGNYAKLRGLGTVAWSYSDFEAMFQVQYIDSLVIHDPAPQRPAVHGQPNRTPYSSMIYMNTRWATPSGDQTKFLAGMQNIADKAADPVFEQRHNANTDVARTICWARFSRFGKF